MRINEAKFYKQENRWWGLAYNGELIVANASVHEAVNIAADFETFESSPKYERYDLSADVIIFTRVENPLYDERDRQNLLAFGDYVLDKIMLRVDELRGR